MKIVCLFSGGMDSTTLLYSLLHSNHKVHALSVLYGQRHSKEVEAARAISAQLVVPHKVLDLDAVLSVFSGSSLTGYGEIPHGHYADATMKSTVVPNRNMVLISLATAFAISVGAETVAYGAHSGDHTIYPDCRPSFISALGAAMQLCHFHPLQLLVPFMQLSKAQIASLGKTLGVPFASTWTCYEGGKLHCGKCGACVERREALGDADPTQYQS